MVLGESELIKKLYLTEQQKAAVVSNLGELYQAVAKNNEHLIKATMAKLIISCYILGRRLGIDFSKIDEEIHSQLMELKQENSDIEKLFGDYSEYERYIRNKR